MDRRPGCDLSQGAWPGRQHSKEKRTEIMASSCLSDITPLTLLDYPGKTACIFWFSLCNLRCRYCYNTSFIKGGRQAWTVTATLEFLKDRAGFLDGVVMSGGECTLFPALIPLAKEAKNLGYLIKIDTNGTRPEVIRRLVEEGLIDYVALDYKAPKNLYKSITGRQTEFEAFSETLDYLIEKQFHFETRTTIHPDLLDEDATNQIINDLARRNYNGTLYLQHYFHTEKNMGNLTLPKKTFDTSLLKKDIPLGFRNFP